MTNHRTLKRNHAGRPASFDVRKSREHFPILSQQIHGRPLVYLDNAASAQKPQVVIDAVTQCYSTSYANVHRGLHALSERVTDAYESARGTVQRFINAADPAEIIFVRGTTEAINLVAGTYGRANVQAGDNIVISEMEHHSNIVPWQMLSEEKRAELRIVPINDEGELLLADRQLLALGDRHLCEREALGREGGILRGVDVALALHGLVPSLAHAARGEGSEHDGDREGAGHGWAPPSTVRRGR